MHYDHKRGNAINLGDDEAIVVGSIINEGEGGPVEIFENGAWAIKKGLDFNVRGVRLIAKNANEIYSFGGFSDSNLNSVNRVYKYDRLADTWTDKGEMLDGSNIPNCGRVEYQGRDKVLCFGSEMSEAQVAMMAFDLEDETWTDLEKAAPTPPPYGSLVFALGPKLYRVRGARRANWWTRQDTLDVFDAVQNEWEPTVALPDVGLYGDYVPYDGVVMTFQVIVKK